MRNPNARVSSPGEFVTPQGSPVVTQYEPRFDGKTLTVVPVGQYDLQAQIESYAPYCDINYMLSRLKVGDMSVINNRPALYGDFSGMPDNPVDAINLVHAAERRFAELTADEKAGYNNDYRVWLASVLGGTLHADDTIANSDSVVDNKDLRKDDNTDES